MFRFFKSRAFLVFIGFVLLAIFIWFAGPYFAFADFRPLEPEFNRLVLIAAIVGLWFLWRIVKRLRALAASDQLLAAVMKQSPGKSDEPSAEVVRLRERFEDGVATLKQHQRKGGRSLYELPWYVIIGAPGSGKTTALLNSGLKFPLEQRVGKGALRGVGGTRNCDWWFTDEAVLLDTAGRYTTQDSDASSDKEGWTEFLTLLSKHRKRRPLNGVILTISAADLMSDNEAERENQTAAARRRLNELNKELKINLPVYLMVTKCDLVAGFAEYFDDLAHEARSQVWGVTFPYEDTASGEAVAGYPAEFDALMERLNQRLLGRIEEDRDVRRRTAIFGFPQQMAALRESLVGFAGEVFGSTRLDQPVLLRGVYFTSGTQEGTPIDRLMGALGRRFGIASDAVVAPTGRGKAYFVEQLIRDVMLGESGLAGLNRRYELKKAAWQLAAYAGLAVLTVALFVALLVSARWNNSYVASVAAALARLRDVPTVSTTASLATLLPRLDAVRNVATVADQYRGNVPWRMRWGLYQGSSLGSSARDAYVRELDGALLPRVASRLRERLIENRSDPEALYEYLKAYLMLGDPGRLDKQYLTDFATAEWKSVDNAASGGASLVEHFQSLLELGGTLRPVALDTAIIAQARASIGRASIPRITYERLKRRYQSDTTRSVRLDVAAGMGAEKTLVRRSGASLTNPVPSLFTRAVFKEATTTATLDLVKQFAADSWVWGDAGMFTSNPVRLAADVTDLYEREYISVWDGVLTDVELATFSSASDMAAALETLSGAGSPLRGLLSTVAQQTTLIDPPTAAPAAPQGTLDKAGKAISDTVGKIVKPLSTAAGLPTLEPGQMVTAHFPPIHRLMVGDPAPIDVLLARVGDVQLQIRNLGGGVGGSSAIAALSNPALRDSLQALQKAAADMPPIFRSLLRDVGKGTETVVMSNATSELETRYREEVLRPCLEVVPDRYPFNPISEREVPLADFRRLFGYGGVYDRFFRENLRELVDTSQRPWTWRDRSVYSSAGMLDAFENAQQIRELFFKPDAARPLVDFDLTLGDTDSGVRRFVLEIDGTFHEFVRGPKRRVQASWPGMGTSQSGVTFEDRSGPRRGRYFASQWGWFRLLDHYPSSRDDTRIQLSVSDAGHQGTIEVSAASIRNPLVNRTWQRFTCGS
jgi:type VI secretion system protein ImpL